MSVNDAPFSYVKRISENQCAMCGRRITDTKPKGWFANKLFMVNKMPLCITCVTEILCDFDAYAAASGFATNPAARKEFEKLGETVRKGSVDRIQNAQRAFETECLARKRLTIVNNATPPKDSMTVYPYDGGVEGTKVETRPIFDLEYFKLYSYVKAYERHKMYARPSVESYKPFVGCITSATEDKLIISNRDGDTITISIDEYVNNGWTIRKIDSEEFGLNEMAKT